MTRSTTIILGACFVVVILLTLITPKPINWHPSYGHDSKDPLGSFIFHDQLNEIYPNAEYVVYNQPLFVSELEYPTWSTYLYLDDGHDADYLDVSILLDFVKEGGDALFITNTLSEPMEDSLGVGVHRHWSWTRPFFKDTLYRSFYLTHPLLDDSVQLNSVLNSGYMYEADSLIQDRITILGLDDDDLPFYYRVEHGHGHFYFMHCPALFSNYALLENQSGELVANALSYLDPSNIYVDEYRSLSGNKQRPILSTLVSQPPMKWAWYIMVFGTLFLLFFSAKRVVRAIPVITPYENASLKYAKKIGKYHYDRKNHKYVGLRLFESICHDLGVSRGHRLDQLPEEQFLQELQDQVISTEDLNELIKYQRRLASRKPWVTEDVKSLYELFKKYYTKENTT